MERLTQGRPTRAALEAADRSLAAAARPMDVQKCARCQDGPCTVAVPCVCACVRLCADCGRRIERTPDALKVRWFCASQPGC